MLRVHQADADGAPPSGPACGHAEDALADSSGPDEPGT